MAMEWTDELIARLKELWGQGLSTAEIGRQLSITKNAVVGKAHRLGLPPRPSPIRNKAGGDEAGKPARPRASRAKKADPESAAEAAPAAKAASKAKSRVGDATGEEKTAPAASAPQTRAGKAAKPVKEKEVPAPVKESPARPAAAAAPRKEKPEAAASGTKAAPRKESVRPVAPPRKVAPPRRVREAMDRPARQGPTCQWPIGDPGTPDFHFCGATPLPGKPYCAEHAAIAYVKIRDRRH